MGLFVDGVVATLEDLRAYDASILEVARVEGVDLEEKLRVSYEELRGELEEFLVARIGTGVLVGGAEMAGIDKLVVTPGLKRWHALRTLELVYSDVGANQAGGRYRWKLEEYRRRARWAADTLYRSGLGFVWDPVPRAGVPEVVGVGGGALEAGTYYVGVSWRNRAGESGCLSPLKAVEVTKWGAIRVRSAAAPVNVAGYDVYAGREPGRVLRQNESAVGLGETFVLSELRDGPSPGDGQKPQWFLRNERVIQRG